MLTGSDFLRMWEESPLSQRELAKVLGVDFDSMHGKLYRAQKQRGKYEGDRTLKTKKYDRVMLRAAVFDIEVTDFSSGGLKNFMACTSVLPLDSDEISTYALSFDDNRDDRVLCVETVKALDEYDILIGHNIAGFDFNWLYSRLMYHGLAEPRKRWLYYDTYQAARRLAIKSERKSLAFLADFFRLEGEKTAVMPVSWSRLFSSDEDEFDEAMADIVDHCEKDVVLNRNLFDALWPRDGKMANLPKYKKW